MPVSSRPARPRHFRIEVPPALRALVRGREWTLSVLGAACGGVAGVVVSAMGLAVNALHELLFARPPGERLSAAAALDPLLAIGVPVLGGLVFGLSLVALARWRPGREVDPIEANALHGGRMSLMGSVVVALQTIWSSGVGASVGLEAGYTQLASGIASSLGRMFRLRRRDLRILVGCGAAGAISGAFGAPLAGAFYAFELIIGSYSVASLAPVGIAALVGYVVASQFEPSTLGIGTLYVSHVIGRDLGVAAAVGLAAALIGITLMHAVALCESTLERLRVPVYLRPLLGGVVVGGLAVISPQVLSSGHGAIHISAIPNIGIQWLLTLLVLKAVASVISLGTGFRGGLFFSSLLLGALAGSVFANVLNALAPSLALAPNVYAIIGMGALSASVIGSPLTMAFIALETTGDFWLTTAVLIAVIVSAVVTRELFGYSFATWRFHLRGETIRSAADVGWIRDLTVRRMMRPDVRTVPARTTIGRFRMVFPLGSTSQVVALDEDKNYAGIVIVAEAHASELDDGLPVREILHHRDTSLLPGMTIKEAVAAFDKAEAEALAVIGGPDNRQVVGLLSEAHALRRYSEELELRRKELAGE
ncbi:chloride channel protein [Xanthobacteraceae bacterium Astr-EGSB]|uniref:chloride channel protein n=1 Tax=Astrobacterium formosum TaxID=3069710 RepID=UPI0027AF8503|nr:chloride channel protein [Xanthobacteraceae bacterium Astr-EGSB]